MRSRRSFGGPRTRVRSVCSPVSRRERADVCSSVARCSDRVSRSHRFFRVKTHGPSQTARREETQVLHCRGGQQGIAARQHDRERHCATVPRRGRLAGAALEDFEGQAASRERSLLGGTGPEPGGARRRGDQASLVHRRAQTSGRRAQGDRRPVRLLQHDGRSRGVSLLAVGGAGSRHTGTSSTRALPAASRWSSTPARRPTTICSEARQPSDAACCDDRRARGGRQEHGRHALGGPTGLALPRHRSDVSRGHAGRAPGRDRPVERVGTGRARRAPGRHSTAGPRSLER